MEHFKYQRNISCLKMRQFLCRYFMVFSFILIESRFFNYSGLFKGFQYVSSTFYQVYSTIFFHIQDNEETFWMINLKWKLHLTQNCVIYNATFTNINKKIQFLVLQYLMKISNTFILIGCLILLSTVSAIKRDNDLKNKDYRRFNFRNQCPYSVWVGGFAVPQLSRTGWQMTANTQTDLSVRSGTAAIRFWARTGCNWVDGKFVCSTGDCGAPPNNFGIQCRGITGQSPATLVELTLSSTGSPDFYDLSNVDGNNMNIYFGPIPGTFRRVDNPDLGKFNCGSPGCKFDQNSCPKQLSKETGVGKACMSICAAVYNGDQVRKFPDILGPIASDEMKRDLVCCACGPGNDGCTDPRSHYCCSPLDPRPNIGGRCYVQNWPKPSQNFDRYDHVFKNQCGDAYSWQFDDISSTYQCIDADYEVVFCP